MLYIFKASEYSFLDLDVEYENGRNPVRTINLIINKLSHKKGVQSILLLDEFLPHSMSKGSTKEQFSLGELDLSKSNVNILLAVNPGTSKSGFNRKFKILPPKNKNSLVYQLCMKHRNGYLIAIFLEHYKLFYQYGCLDSSQDIPLKEDNLPSGRSPVWIQREKSVTDESVLEQIKRDHVLEHESVTLLYNDYSIKENISQWCYQNNWKYIEKYEFYGCEDQVIVTFDLNYLYPEQVSRAKNGLIILTTKGYVLKVILYTSLNVVWELSKSFTEYLLFCYRGGSDTFHNVFEDAIKHENANYQCKYFKSKCPYKGIKFMQKIELHDM